MRIFFFLALLLPLSLRAQEVSSRNNDILQVGISVTKGISLRDELTVKKGEKLEEASFSGAGINRVYGLDIRFSALPVVSIHAGLELQRSRTGYMISDEEAAQHTFVDKVEGPKELIELDYKIVKAVTSVKAPIYASVGLGKNGSGLQLISGTSIILNISGSHFLEEKKTTITFDDYYEREPIDTTITRTKIWRKKLHFAKKPSTENQTPNSYYKGIHYETFVGIGWLSEDKDFQFNANVTWSNRNIFSGFKKNEVDPNVNSRILHVNLNMIVYLSD